MADTTKDVNQMTDDEKIEHLMDIVKSYIGTKEEPAGSNNVIFNTDYYGREVSGDNYAWCCAFVWDMFRMAGLSEYFYGGNKVASCTKLRDFHKDRIVTDSFKYGDLIFFNFKNTKLDPLNSTCYHMGFFSSQTATTITTIDGNTSNTSEDNGGNVMKKTRMKDCVVCGIRLIGDLENVKYQNCTLPIIRNGYSMPAVTAIQAALNALGYNCGTVDGIFGPNTEAGVKAFQKANGLYVDGRVGKDTYKKIFATK